MKPLASLIPIAPLMVGCGAVATAKSIQTYAEPVAGSAAYGTVRIVPRPPVITPTRALYEWQIVGDRMYGSFASRGAETTISGGRSVSRLSGALPTVVIYFVEIVTTPHGDGSMAMEVKTGERSAKTRPLLSPSAPASSGGGGYGSSSQDGYKELPAGSFVRPLITTPTDLPLPATADLAHIDLPPPAYGVVTAVKYGPRMTEKTAYRKRVPLDSRGDLPDDAMSNPTLNTLQKQGYQVMGSMGVGKGSHETARIIVRP